MTKLHPLVAGLIAAGAICSASSSQAQVIYSGYGETNFPGNISSTVTITDTSLNFKETTSAGPFTTLLSSSSNGSKPVSVDTYCVDIFHTINGPIGGLNKGYEALKVISGSSFTTSKDFSSGGSVTASAYQLAGLGRAAWLVDNIPGIAGSSLDKAALQIAIWKAEYETDTKNLTNLTGGAITFTGVNAKVAADATAYLKDSLNNGQLSTAVGDWVSYQADAKGYAAQDQIFDPRFNPVPEPASLAICGTALLSLTGVSWRKARKARAAQA